MIRHLVHGFGEMLEDYCLSGFHLVHCQVSHVVVVHKKGSRIGKGHFLIYHPAFRHVIVKGVEEPHSIVLHYHLFTTCFFLKLA